MLIQTPSDQPTPPRIVRPAEAPKVHRPEDIDPPEVIEEIRRTAFDHLKDK